MSSNRIQKLLFSEYSDFEDIVLVESPFAETSKYGRGVRQVHMGLTPTKLILASYNIDPADNMDLVVGRKGRLDPDIESFELISAYPVECVNLSVFRKTKRYTVKARFCNGKVLYLELGGWLERKILWEMWCDRIKFLSPSEESSTVSETSVATSSTSTTSSTLYITRSCLSVTKSGRSQLWCQYSKSNTSLTTTQETSSKLESSEKTETQSSVEDSFSETQQLKKTLNQLRGNNEGEHMITRLPDDGFRVSEKSSKTKRPHLRRYAFTPQPWFLYGLGCWPLSRGDAFSVQVKRVVSAVNLSCEPKDDFTSLPLPRELLKASISCDNLFVSSASRQSVTVSKEWSDHYKKRPSVLFWTPGYQYRPRSRRAEYRLIQNQLRSCRGEPLLSQTGVIDKGYWQVWDVPAKDVCNTTSSTNSFGGNCYPPEESVFHYPFYAPVRKRSGLYGYLSQEAVSLHEALTLNVDLTLWDFNTIILAHQLTMIDRHLLLKIPREELGILLRQRCIQNAPNILALVTFSYRVSCLVATHIVKCITVKNRARIVIKFIKIASYCDVLRNMQTTKSVLCGLQSPAVYRLHGTWAYVRKHYYTKYSIFVDLCFSYKDPRLPLFQKTYNAHTASPPSIPCVSHIITLLLNKMPQYYRKCTKCIIADNVYKWRMKDTPDSQAELPKSLRRFLSAFQIYQIPSGPSEHSNPSCSSSGDCVCSCSDEATSRLDDFFGQTNKTTHKQQVLENAERFLIASQEAALNYGFKTNFLAKEFLLKAQYKEDKDNFFFSLKVEDA